MKWTSIFMTLSKVWFIQKGAMLRFNYLSKRVTRINGGKVYPCKHSCLFIDKEASLQLNGKLYTNYNPLYKAVHRSTIIRLDRNARMIVNGDFKIFYGGDITVFEGGCLTVQEGFLNSDVIIRCKSEITIGCGCAISHGVTIQDFDGHQMYEKDGAPRTVASPIIIEDHVWIGANASVFKGVRVGQGAVIAGNAVVTKDVPANCLAAGVPARILKQDVIWR